MSVLSTLRPLAGCLAGTLALASPAGAEVGNPGLLTLTLESGLIAAGNKAVDLTTPACRNFRDDDGDARTDHPSDPGCASPTDDDEAAPGEQAAEPFALQGSIDADGRFQAPPTIFPGVDLLIPFVGVGTVVLEVEDQATGVLDPTTGQADLGLDFRIHLVDLPPPCEAVTCEIDPAPLTLAGQDYAPDGSFSNLNASFAAPAAHCSGADTALSCEGLLNSLAGLPAAAGRNVVHMEWSSDRPLVEPIPFSLEVTPSCAAEWIGIRGAASGLTPGGSVVVLSGRTRSSVALPDYEGICPGLRFAVQPNPSYGTQTFRADPEGGFSAANSQPVHRSACGWLVQLFDPNTCSVSEAVEIGGVE